MSELRLLSARCGASLVKREVQHHRRKQVRKHRREILKQQYSTLEVLDDERLCHTIEALSEMLVPVFLLCVIARPTILSPRAFRRSAYLAVAFRLPFSLLHSPTVIVWCVDGTLVHVNETALTFLERDEDTLRVRPCWPSKELDAVTNNDALFYFRRTAAPWYVLGASFLGDLSNLEQLLS